ncbi:mRNA cap guanine-N7 methyltransferase-like [Mya arenaria]|uniref:mRNA cap guanine-N7 methyltransferase-like n=1 Tax=Mya arenaria TaxID=6604 RepID=UPI0022E82DA5|nr:mRNA cap guanine-N7 methyltransferase-like [Mya arenaria]
MSVDGAGQGDLVAKHYNQLQESGRESRMDSRIFYMRNFNNWIKSVVINEALQRVKGDKGHDRDISVLDLCSGKGGDLLKWKKGNIRHIVCADIAETSVEQSEQRYRDMVSRERFSDRVFTAQFIAADCSKTRLKDKYKDADIQFDVCSCQFSFHYCFESLPQAEMMLRNAVENLKLGGYFIGTTPNSQELVRRVRDSDDMSFGNDVYRVTFETENKEELPLFGAKYNFHLEGVVDCPEFLVFFPVLEKMAEKHGMKLISRQPFAEFFNKHSEDRDYKSLLGRMQALEKYPPESGSKLLGLEDRDYEHVKSYVDGQAADDSNQGRPVSVGTLSKAEWEAVTIYCVFMFQKVRDPATGETWQGSATADASNGTPDSEQSRKRPANEASDTEPPKVPRPT